MARGTSLAYAICIRDERRCLAGAWSDASCARRVQGTAVDSTRVQWHRATLRTGCVGDNKTLGGLVRPDGHQRTKGKLNASGTTVGMSRCPCNSPDNPTPSFPLALTSKEQVSPSRVKRTILWGLGAPGRRWTPRFVFRVSTRWTITMLRSQGRASQL